MPPSVIALLAAANAPRIEVMNAFFTKIHLGDGRAVHHFTAADEGDEWHDHPWSFVSEVLHGGYEEEIITGKNDYRISIEHLPGETHMLFANHIHRITRLLDIDCWTLVTAGPVEREVSFYRVRDGMVQSRRWDEAWP